MRNASLGRTKLTGFIELLKQVEVVEALDNYFKKKIQIESHPQDSRSKAPDKNLSHPIIEDSRESKPINSAIIKSVFERKHNREVSDSHHKRFQVQSRVEIQGVNSRSKRITKQNMTCTIFIINNILKI